MQISCENSQLPVSCEFTKYDVYKGGQWKYYNPLVNNTYSPTLLHGWNICMSCTASPLDSLSVKLIAPYTNAPVSWNKHKQFIISDK